MMFRQSALVGVWCALLAGCGEEASVTPDAGEAPRNLSELRLFRGNGATQEPAEGVFPYTVTSPLFSDYTAKYRFIRLPPGARITYSPRGVWRLPVGTVLVKTFAYLNDARDGSRGQRLLETRVLIKTAEGFIPHTYVWNDAQTEAIRRVAGVNLDTVWIDSSGATRNHVYTVPNTNQCLTCHGQQGMTDTLGLRNEQIDRARADGTGNQIDDMVARGMFDVTPPPAAMRTRFVDPRDESQALEERARSYLHGNCAHCHNPNDRSMARSSGLNLDISETSPVNLGVCRRPNSAGRGTGGRFFDVVPGHADQSVMVFRMETTDSELRMPQVGTNLPAAFGVEIVSRWINAMPAADCAR